MFGVKCTPGADTYSFDGVDLPPNLIITKRIVLSCIARIFDPIGFLTPFTIAPKVLFSEIVADATFLG